jgi:uncharacterized membrane protein YgdD (TMEM256/DUF423 family)
MNPVNKRMALTAAIGAIGVALGALGAHFLRDQMEQGHLSLRQFEGFEAAVRYQLIHVLSIILVLFFYKVDNRNFYWTASTLFLVGILLFSGSIYLLSLRTLMQADWLKMVGPLTPLGGLAFIGGWLVLMVGFLKKG